MKNKAEYEKENNDETLEENDNDRDFLIKKCKKGKDKIDVMGKISLTFDAIVPLAMSRLKVLLSPDRYMSCVEEEQTLLTSDSWMAHCLSPFGLLNRQNNQGKEEEQEMVRLDPSGMILPFGGCVETIDIALKCIVNLDLIC